MVLRSPDASGSARTPRAREPACTSSRAVALPTTRSVAMKVRIRKTPVEREIDGVKLDRLAPGAVRDMSSSLATWLIVEGYAEPEMRRSPGADEAQRFGGSEERSVAEDRRRKNF